MAEHRRRTALLTGTAGFIGFHLATRLLQDGWRVIGIDGFTPYYDVALKQARHRFLKQSPDFTEHVFLLEDAAAVAAAHDAAQPDLVVHLAAQAGVRYSIENPRAYVDANLVGTFNLLEAVRAAPPQHLILASTSSVYGGNPSMPFQETDRTDFPLTIYAATKKAAEAMTHNYSHLWSIPTTVLRFFTVYGPWGRPDMALFKFVKAISTGAPIEVYGQGQMLRDFTYVGDLVEAAVRLIERVPVMGVPASPGDSLSPVAPWRVVNIGGGQPVNLMDFVATIERALGRVAEKIMLPIQAGDVQATYAKSDLLRTLTGYTPSTSVADGVGRFVAWYREHYATG
ncbi:MAG: NAD-dependent epimerase/dehydratase family protein [Rhodospirillaceae bacterium]|nr:NAD-dependent epimerase/dehydratase family protein [Rhodospirillaceae bacterium]